MNDAPAAPTGLAPWHLWCVGLLMLAWNALCCYSHLMTLTQNAAYFRATGVTPEIAAYFRGIACLVRGDVDHWSVG